MGTVETEYLTFLLLYLAVICWRAQSRSIVKHMLKPGLPSAKLTALSYLLSYLSVCKVTCINPPKWQCQSERFKRKSVRWFYIKLLVHRSVSATLTYTYTLVPECSWFSLGLSFSPFISHSWTSSHPFWVSHYGLRSLWVSTVGLFYFHTSLFFE